MTQRRLLLKRIARTQNATFGVLIEHNVPFCVTLEDPWKDNLPHQSCIPPGTYLCRRGQFPQHGATYEVTEVPNRTAILFHKGNSPVDTEGCILVGEEFGVLEGHPAVLASGRGFQEFLVNLAGETEFLLTIVDLTGDPFL